MIPTRHSNCNPKRYPRVIIVLALLSNPAFCRQTASAQNAPAEPEAKRILWIIPNFRTSPSLAQYKPIAPREKFRIAILDSFDRGTVALGVLFGAEVQLTDSNPSFGQGVCGYARVSKLGSQLAVDMASNILKEFWPDLERKFSRKRKNSGSNGST
jgi:hypothetical protein